MLSRPIRILAAALVLMGLIGLPCERSAVAEGDAKRGAGDVARMLDRVLPREQRVELRYLLHLGWRFERDATVREVTIDGGTPCRHATLEAAQAAGALRVRVPTAFSESQARELGGRLSALADGIPSRCAYQFKHAAALKRAVARFEAIEEAGRYEFPRLFELVNSPFWGLRLPECSWTNVDGVYVAYGSSARAMESIWRRGGVVECYTGQWLAIFGAQYELYGPRFFERTFAANDLQIGKPSKIKPAPIGQATRSGRSYDYRVLLIPPPDQRKDAFLALAEHGPLAYAGAVGVMRNTNADGAQMNENFTIVEVSPAAVRQLRENGGARYLNGQCAEVWKLLNADLPGGPLRRLGGDPGGEAAKAIDRILAQPVFSEVKVYVHPYGTTTFEDLVRDKFPEDETPPAFVIYRHGRESLLYRRYHRAWKARCAAGGPCR